jgi:UDP-N-acetylmuramoyl-tripeptide--D-alanyl-D-alanine ligase
VIPLSVDEVRRLAPGELTARDERVTGVEIDSRRVGDGDLFVAVGRGAEFVDEALARGAAAALVPDDAFAALAALAGAVRERSRAQVVGITGSVGKTSTKDILAALCRPHASTVAAEAGFNNEVGLPLTLLRIELGAYDALGLPLDRAGDGSPAIAFSRLRGEELELPGGALLINDAWNANPVSMRAALAYLVRRADGRRTIAVLGAMAELGPDAPRYHSEVGDAVREVGVDVLIAVGGGLADRYGGTRAATPDEAAALLRHQLQPDDVVLVKASRVHRLERIAEALVGAPAG